MVEALDRVDLLGVSRNKVVVLLLLDKAQAVNITHAVNYCNAFSFFFALGGKVRPRYIYLASVY